MENESLVSKVYMPRILAPMAAVLPHLLDLALALPLVWVLMLALGLRPGPQVALLPVWILGATVSRSESVPFLPRSTSGTAM